MNELHSNKAVFINTGDAVAALSSYGHIGRLIEEQIREGGKGIIKRPEKRRQIDVFLEPKETLGTV